MQPGDQLEVTARVVGLIEPGVYRVVLRNGHELIAHLPRRLRATAVPLDRDAEVRLRVSPFDMTDGLILPSLTSSA